ncbi:hypothetical protein, partial [Burkholderia thailandensis]|uniref:hypothetical protein n=1 Tax=Burkholderia thailandensis TaxID=57975 RepID=UPI00358EAC19
RLDVDLQSRPPEHGLGRIYAKTAAGHGRLVSTSEPRAKRGDYPLTGIPASASFRNPMICCSVKRFFMFVFFSENELY